MSRETLKAVEDAIVAHVQACNPDQESVFVNDWFVGCAVYDPVENCHWNTYVSSDRSPYGSLGAGMVGVARLQALLSLENEE